MLLDFVDHCYGYTARNLIIVYSNADTGSEVKRALQTLSMALVIDEEASRVRPHLHGRSASASSEVVTEKRELSMEQVKAQRLSQTDCDSIKDIAFKHLLLSHYRNQLLHWFITDAMLALSLSLNGDGDAKSGKLVHILSLLSLLLALLLHTII